VCALTILRIPLWYARVRAPLSFSSMPLATRSRCESSSDGSILSASASIVAMKRSSAAKPSVLSRPLSNCRRYDARSMLRADIHAALGTQSMAGLSEEEKFMSLTEVQSTSLKKVSSALRRDKQWSVSSSSLE